MTPVTRWNIRGPMSLHLFHDRSLGAHIVFGMSRDGSERINGERINGWFHLLIHGVFLVVIGRYIVVKVHPLIRSPLIPALPCRSRLLGHPPSSNSLGPSLNQSAASGGIGWIIPWRTDLWLITMVFRKSHKDRLVGSHPNGYTPEIQHSP